MDHRDTARVRLGLIGAGRIGAHHAAALARHVWTAELVAVGDAVPESARRLGAELGVPAAGIDDLLSDESLEAVVVTASSAAHSELVQRAAGAGKAVFCEKPMGMSLAEVDAATSACERAGVPLQVGFNRRFSGDFAAAHGVVDRGEIGTPHLLRSVTRDPGLADPGVVPPWTIFTQTLIHDFDVLRWLNPGASAVEVHAFADALVAPAFKDSGLLDTALVTIRFDNGALATAEASFSAAYGYDARGEVFGSAGMVTIGSPVARELQVWTGGGVHKDTARSDTELLHEAYVAELLAFCDSVRHGSPVAAGGADARAAFEVALAAIASVEQGAPVLLDDVRVAA